MSSRYIFAASLFLICAVWGAPFLAYAEWDGQPYAPGTTLNPECAPTDENCTVDAVWSIADGNANRATGNVGIGTETPASKLEVNGDVRISGESSRLYFSDGSSMFTAAGEGSGVNGWNDINFETGGQFNFITGDGTASSTKVVITNDGRVGIGTSTPTEALTVAGNILSLNTLGGGAYIHEVGGSQGNDITTLFSDSNRGAFWTGEYTNVDATSSIGYATGVFGQNNFASGYASFIAGGFGNYTLGSGSFIGGGQGNTVSGDYSAAFGRGMTVSGSQSFGVGLDGNPYTLNQWHTFSVMGGKVGIGTTAPTAKLDVVSLPGTSGGDEVANFTSNDTWQSGFGVANLSSAAAWQFMVGGSANDSTGVDVGNFGFYNAATHDFPFIMQRDSDNVILNRDAGAVGIGESSPVSQLANTSVNTLDTAGTGSNLATGLSWAANGPGYAISAVNTGEDSNANGLLVQTIGTASTNRILTLNANGADAFVVQGNGNVGIGTADATSKLTVSGSANQEVAASIYNTDPGDRAAALLRLGNDTANGMILFENSSARTDDGGANVGTLRNDAGDLRLQSAGENGLTVQSGTGFLGIGTAAPAEELTIDQGSTAGNPFSGTGALLIGGTSFSSDSHPFVEIGRTTDGSDGAGYIQAGIAGAGAGNLVLNPAGGNVGIGTASPEDALDVRGNVAIQNDGDTYLNFNSSRGDGGYGFRMSDGVMQFKNVGDSGWTDIGAGTASPVSHVAANGALGTNYLLDETSWASADGPTLPVPMVSSQVAVIGDYLYLFGGYGNSGTLDTIYRAPVSNPTDWSDTGAHLPGPLSDSQVAIIGSYIYLFGGYNADSYTDVIYRAPVFDPTNWEDTGETIPAAVAAAQVAVIGDYVYLFGGNSVSGPTDTIYRAPVSNPTDWSDTGAILPHPTADSQLAIVGGKVYLFSGDAGGGSTSAMYWAPLSDPTDWTGVYHVMPTGVTDGQVAVIGDYIYVFGGYIPSGASDVIYRAPVSDPTDWVNTGETIPGNLIGSQLAVVNNIVYLFGGYDGTANTDVIYGASIGATTNNGKSWTSQSNYTPLTTVSSTTVSLPYNVIVGGYLNFGDTSGNDGFGFRNENGTLQFKNSGGDWQNFGDTFGAGGAAVGLSHSTLTASRSFAGESFNDTFAVVFGDSGSKMYVGNNSIYHQYTLSTPYDITSATYDDVSFNPNIGDGESTWGIAFDSSGNNIYVTDNDGNVHEFPLNTPWDLSSVGDESAMLDVSGQIATAGGTDAQFNGDGTAIDVADYNTGKIFEYDLTDAWDLSTASYSGKSLDVSGDISGVGNLESIKFTQGGTRLYDGVFNRDESFNIHEYTLARPYDLTSATEDDGSYAIPSDVYPEGYFTFKDDATFDVTVKGAGRSEEALNEYTFGSNGFTPVSGSLLLSGSNNYLNFGTATSSAGYGIRDNNGTLQFKNSGGDWQNFGGGTFSLAGSQRVGVTALGFPPISVAFGNSGAKMYIVGIGGSTIKQYTLSTPWDVSSATDDNISTTTSESEYVDGISFDSTGTKLFVVDGTTNHLMYEYDLTAPWDISTAAYSGNSADFSSQTSSIADAAFSPDGRSLYVIDYNTATVYKYTLAGPWDIADGLTYSGTSMNLSGNVAGFAGSVQFSGDGSHMYVSGSDGGGPGAPLTIYGFTLETPWDITTATLGGGDTFQISGSYIPLGFFTLSSDATKFYIGVGGFDFATPAIYEYSFGASGGAGGSGTVGTGTAGALAFYAADGTTLSATSSIFIDPNTGNIGIGTTSPQATFEIEGPGAGSFLGFPSLLNIHSADENPWGLTFQNDTAGTSSEVGFALNDRGSLYLSTGQGNVLGIAQSGSVLIGTSTDSSYLNFGGGDTFGELGLGIRMFNGTMQYRNSGGEWTDFGGGGVGDETISGNLTVSGLTSTASSSVRGLLDVFGGGGNDGVTYAATYRSPGGAVAAAPSDATSTYVFVPTRFEGVDVGFDVVNVADHLRPTFVSNYTSGSGRLESIKVLGNYAYGINDDGNVEIVDISDLRNPTLHDTFSLEGHAIQFILGIYQNEIYVTADDGDLYRISISDPASPSLAEDGSLTPAHPLEMGSFDGDLGIFRDAAAKIEYINVPDFTDTYTSDLPQYIDSITVSGDLIYAVDDNGNFDIFRSSASGEPLVELSTFTSPTSCSNGSGAPVITGHYALVLNCNNGYDVIDVSNVAVPSYVGVYYSQNGDLQAPAIFGNYVYGKDENGNLEIIDVSAPKAPVAAAFTGGRVGVGTDLPSAAFSVVGQGGPIVTYQSSYADPDNLSTPYFANDNYLYAVNNNGAIDIVDEKDPSHPILMNTYSTDTSLSQVYVADSLMAATGNDGTIRLIDITDKSEPHALSTVTGQAESASLTHSVIAGTTLYALDQGDGSLEMYDITDPSSPVYLGNYLDGDDALSMSHEPYVQNGTAYLMTADGLVVAVDVHDPTAATKIGQYAAHTGSVESFMLEGQQLVVENSDQNIELVDAADPTELALGYQSTYYPGSGLGSDIDGPLVYNNYMYLGNDDCRLEVVDITDPSSPNWIANYESSTDCASHPFITGGGRAYVYNDYGQIESLNISGVGRPSNAATFIDGLVGIGTETPSAQLDVAGNVIFSGSSRYLNFGWDTGDNGYGIRDDDGTLEFKNDGGDWTPFGGTTFWTSGGGGSIAYNGGDVSIGGGLTVNGGDVSIGDDLFYFNNSTGETSIDNLSIGALSFPADAGAVSWIDLPVDGSVTANTIESYSASIGGNAILTVYGEADGTGGVQHLRIGIGTSTPASALDVNGTIALEGAASSGGLTTLCLNSSGQIVTNIEGGCTSSTERIKHDIAGLSVSGTSTIMQITPSSFVYNSDASSTVRWGFIAEDLASTSVTFIDQFDASGQPLTINPVAILSVAVKAIQELTAEIAGFAESFTSKQVQTDKLCVGDTCVTQEQFLKILQAAGVQPGSPDSSESADAAAADAPAPADSTDSASSTAPDEGSDTATSTDVSASDASSTVSADGGGTTDATTSADDTAATPPAAPDPAPAAPDAPDASGDSAAPAGSGI